MRVSNIVAGVIGAGVVGTVVTAGYYMGLSPKNQRELQKNLKKTVGDLADIAGTISETVSNLKG